MAHTRATVNKAFGMVLKGVVRENGKTQQGVADHIGQNVATINRIFGGKREVTVTQFLEIADYCGEDPKLILDRVLAKLRTMSALPDNVTPLPVKVADMTDDQVAELEGAAGFDEELERPEPDNT